LGIRFLAMQATSDFLFGAGLLPDELRQALHGEENFPISFVIRRRRNAEFFLDRESKLKRIDGIEPKAFYEKGLVRIDLIRFNILKSEGFND
jgi:hypothetical protein